jgi:5'-methylthioadenosine phosphorylase
MTEKPVLSVIGGSGLYSMDGLEHVETLELDTPFGKPSAPIIVGTFAGKAVAFLARHGIGHHLSPTEVNYRANIYALKSIGVDRIVSISACGSLREDFIPGHIVIPDQLFDFTRDRSRSFFGGGLVAHISSADPFCPDLSEQVYKAVVETGAVVHRGGTLITIEGPRFSTKAESHQYRSWGMSIIGMTACPEAFLAREAEICYTTMAHVTDYDVWHTTEEPVSVDMVIRTLMKNTSTAQEAVKKLATELHPERNCSCSSAMENAIITNRDVIPMETKTKLNLLVSKYL